ncbi:MAG: competence protein ComEA helix-hairpin-helix repeat region [Chthonomonadaceae bacterium]|nr:competence protein ComEA helix-hairpin-helix repeat region [Chthonomonadaceae bacterium]
MGQLTRAQTIGIVALLAVVTGWVGLTALHTGPPSSPPGIVVRDARPTSGRASSTPLPPGSVGTTPTSLTAPASDTSATEIVVHVAGAVKKPGVYHLQPGARNDDAVHAAGGFTAAANADAVNLAANSEDGSQLYIPTRAEHPSGGDTTHDSAVTPSVSTVEASGSASHPAGSKSGGKSSHSSGKFSDPSQGQVNLNTADAAQLQHIPGIGPAMAERILAYRRTAGRFQSPDELLQISGIGDKKFQKMKPYLTVR